MHPSERITKKYRHRLASALVHGRVSYVKQLVGEILRLFTDEPWREVFTEDQILMPMNTICLVGKFLRVVRFGQRYARHVLEEKRSLARVHDETCATALL